MRLLNLVLALSLLSCAAFGQGVNGSRGFPITNDTSTGTVVNGTAVIDSAGQAIAASTFNGAVPTYVVINNAGTAGSALLASTGLLAKCTMDSTIASAAGGYYVINSPTTNAECHAQSTAPASGTWVIGYLVSSSTTSGATALIVVDGFVLGSSGGGSMTWPMAPGITVCSGTPCNAWAASLAAPSSTIAGISDSQAFTNKDFTGAGNIFPTFNQNTTGSAAKWTTARTLAGNSVDGSANVPFVNKFVVEGTADSSLTGAQFLGALATCVLKNTTTTGVLSCAGATDIPGGPGVVNPAAHSVPVAEGSSPWDFQLPGVTGLCFMSNGSLTDPSFQNCPSGFVNPMTLAGQMIYENASPAPAALSGPTGPNGITQSLCNTPSGGSSGLPTWCIPGVGIDAQTGTSYTIPITDDVTFVTGNNASATTWTGFALANNYAFAFENLGAGLITYTPASGTVNGNATQIIPKNWFGFHYTDNANTFMPVLPTIQAFTNCANGVTFTAATGALGCLSAAPIKSGDAAGGDLSGTYPNPGVAKINGTAFAGSIGNLVGFGASNIPVDTTIPYANVVTATSHPAAGLCHFAGATQNCTSSPVVNGDVSGQFSAAHGATGIDTSASSGSPVIASGTWSVVSLVANQAVNGSATNGTASGFTDTAGTVTSGHLACYTASNTIGNCTGTPSNNFLGVFNSSTTWIASGEVSVTLDGTVNVTFGDNLCASSTAGLSHDNGAIACATGESVGVVKTTASSVSSATAFIRMY